MKRTMTAACVLAVTCAVQTVSADMISLNPVADASIVHRDGNAAYLDYTYGSAVDLDLSTFDANINYYSYARFDLSSLGDIVINSATLTFTKIANVDGPLTLDERNDTIVDTRIAISGLNNVAGNTAQNWGETTLSFNSTGNEIDATSNGTADPFNSGSGLSTSFNGQETILSGNTVISLTGAPLVSWLQGRENDGGLSTFLLSFETVGGGRGYALGARESASPGVLTLDYTVVPEPSALVLIAVGGAVLVMRRRKI